jgi:NADPH:quinone reductase-like Zn-dependent oxidoreductase
MKAIVVKERAAGTAGMKLVERPKPRAAINDVVVRVHASGFVPTELTWPSTWTDRLDRDRTPSIPGHELAGVVTALGYGTTGLSVGQRVFGLAPRFGDRHVVERALFDLAAAREERGREQCDSGRAHASSLAHSSPT